MPILRQRPSLARRGQSDGEAAMSTAKCDRNSMYVWLPAVEKAGVPSPKTEMVYLGWQPMIDLMDHKPLPKHDEIEETP